MPKSTATNMAAVGSGDEARAATGSGTGNLGDQGDDFIANLATAGVIVVGAAFGAPGRRSILRGGGCI